MDARALAIEEVEQRLEALKSDPDHSGGYWDYYSDLNWALEKLKTGANVAEVMGNI